MNVMFISQCSGNALTETRRILDQFAERRGERSWQTPITELGLRTVHRLLRQKARKNTAVACLWIRGRDHGEMVWIVGDARRFNAQGGTPTNTTRRDVLRSSDEDDWHHGEDIRLLASLAALFHDLGKANAAFQEKLANPRPIADAYRHEWVSLRLFEAFVGRGGSDDRPWLQRLARADEDLDDDWRNRLLRDGVDGRTPVPLRALPPLAQAVGWLIVSHHRLPTHPDRRAGLPRYAALNALHEQIDAQWCGARRETGMTPDGRRAKTQEKELKRARTACWEFPHGLPFTSHHWRGHVNRIARAMLARHGLLSGRWLDDPYALHLARLALMLADHYYSARESLARYGDAGHPLVANTRDGKPNQRLDEHLIGVEVSASRLVRGLPRLAHQLARIARHRGFGRRSRDPLFRWQDRAYDLATGIRDRTVRQGFFGIDMASTGCGKTLANGRILYGLANPNRGARFTVALGLRVLTLQTGDAYRHRLGLGPEDMAVLVGGGAVRTLHEHRIAQAGEAATPGELEQAGRESSEELLGGHDHVHFEGSMEDGPLNRWLQDSPDAQRLVNAPVLICTIDHLMPATEGTRGGRQIAPMLRLLGSDLVLDEPDDFDVQDLPALTRLVHWAGLLGSRVLLSSATLPPALVQGLFEAYWNGRQGYRCNRGEAGASPRVCCAWFDEYHADAGDQDATNGLEGFAAAHAAFVDRRLRRLAKAAPRRHARVLPLAIDSGQPRETICAALAESLRNRIGDLHDLHAQKDPRSGKRVSIGLVRMANIDPLVLTAQALYRLGAPEGRRIHLCVYHAQHPLLVRSGIEARLDRLLNRTDRRALFRDPEMRGWLSQYPEPDQVFVVLATAVAEVGRDHDYDWAIVEPSSVRSIIQLAGRVRRHRPEPWDETNILLLETNVRHLERPGGPAFCKPGFESPQFPLARHDLPALLTPEQLARIDASARIRERAPLSPRENLADLEHACLRAWMLGEKTDGEQQVNPVHLWWTTRAALSGELQRRHPFRKGSEPRQRYALVPDEDGEIGFLRFEKDGTTTPQQRLCHPLDPQPGPRVGFWGEPDYLTALEELAESFGTETAKCARRFGVIDLPDRDENGWWYHEALGFTRYK